MSVWVIGIQMDREHFRKFSEILYINVMNLP